MNNTEQITPEQAFEILWDGHSILVNTDAPILFLTDILDNDVMDKMTRQQIEVAVCEYLQNYEIYR